MGGSGFEVGSGVSDADTPTWCLEQERTELLALQKKSPLNKTDSGRLIELVTLIGSKKIIES